MKEYRVRFWQQEGDGKAEIQKYVDRLHAYETIVGPRYEV